MKEEKGAERAPSYQELEECLRLVAQSLEWYAHGSCRGFHDGRPLKTVEATDLAKETLERIGIPKRMPSKHDVPEAYRCGDEPLAWLAGYATAVKVIFGKPVSDEYKARAKALNAELRKIGMESICITEG